MISLATGDDGVLKKGKAGRWDLDGTCANALLFLFLSAHRETDLTCKQTFCRLAPNTSRDSTKLLTIKDLFVPLGSFLPVRYVGGFNLHQLRSLAWCRIIAGNPGR